MTRARPTTRRPAVSPPIGLSLDRQRPKDHLLAVGGTTLVADPAGALYWSDERLLLVADLHLEKGSAFARRGVLLPPYDTATTLARLGRLIEHYAPRLLAVLGDSFHDIQGPLRMSAGDRATLAGLQRRRDWIWIAGNHDPRLPAHIGGHIACSVTLGPLTLRHVPCEDAAGGEIAGHLHPIARVAQRGRVVSRRCFVGNARRVVMPAFGAYAGGLNARHHAIAMLFGESGFTAHVLGTQRLFEVAAGRCLPD